MRIAAILMILALFGCSKKPNTNVITVKGQMMHLKDSTTYGNTDFVIFQEGWASGFNKKPEPQTVPFRTTADGYFSVTFNSVSTDINLCYHNNPTNIIGSSIAYDNIYGEKLPNNTYDFGKVYAKK